ncbi:uncharacterized protein DFL_004622 [Arthrobotrys flagrans]|uniref:DUF7962 domain-containing protein n=1 Tax=Arthrobotrys flagrans TaxID=97331 RepID=A0A437A5Q6_ARTFL|nr:hypothetical protein DFL_004622 [Arthrobotrys flagrans]
MAAADIRDAMEILETKLLADGRDWVLKTDRPMLADIEVVWLFEWTLSMVDAKAKESPAEEIKGDAAASKIFSSVYAEEERVVEAEAVVTVQGLKKDDLVNVYPTDNKDMGSIGEFG